MCSVSSSGKARRMLAFLLEVGEGTATSTTSAWTWEQGAWRHDDCDIVTFEL